MSITSPKKPVVCLELAVADVFRAIVELRRAPQACFLMVLGAQAAWWLGLPYEMWYLPLLCMLCAAGWGVLCWHLAERLCPLEGGFTGLVRTLIQGGGFRLPRWGVLLGGAAAFGLALALPWWPASLLWAALVAIFVLYPRCGKAALVTVLVTVSLGAAAVGMVVLLLGYLATSPVTRLNTGCGALLLLSLFAAWADALLLSGGWSRAPFRFAWALPAVLPLLMLHWDSLQVVAPLCLMGLLATPAALVIASLDHHRRALGRCQDLIGRHGLEKSIIGKDASGVREDAVRDSDDYFRVCHPEFRHWLPARTGDKGYLAWIGGADDRTLTEDCIVFRTTNLAVNPLTKTQDPIGRTLADLVKKLLPNLKLGALDPLRKAFDAWTVRRLTRHEIVAKMPWDHPAMVVIPVRWSGCFIYPAGSGIHDQDGYPCRARKVEVSLCLRPEVLGAVERTSASPEAASTQDLRLCRLLLWNARRILPGAYESLLTCLVRLFRHETVALFVDLEAGAEEGNGLALSSGAQEAFRRRLNADWADALPPPLRELIDAQVAELAIDTYYESAALNLQLKLRQMQRSHLFQMKKDLSTIGKQINDFVHKGELARHKDADGEDVGEIESVRSTLWAVVAQARSKIMNASSVAVETVNELRRNAEKVNSPERIASMFGQVQAKMGHAHEAFLAVTKQRFDEIDETLKNLPDLSAFTDDD